VAAVAAIAYPVAISARGIAIMLKFAAGLVLGLTLGAAVAAFATDEIEDGYLAGWVVTMNRQAICADPYVYASSRMILCQ